MSLTERRREDKSPVIPVAKTEGQPTSEPIGPVIQGDPEAEGTDVYEKLGEGALDTGGSFDVIGTGAGAKATMADVGTVSYSLGAVPQELTEAKASAQGLTTPTEKATTEGMTAPVGGAMSDGDAYMFNYLERYKLQFDMEHNSPDKIIGPKELLIANSVRTYRQAILEAQSEEAKRVATERFNAQMSELKKDMPDRPALDNYDDIIRNQKIITIAGQLTAAAIGAVTGRYEAGAKGSASALEGGVKAIEDTKREAMARYKLASEAYSTTAKATTAEMGKVYQKYVDNLTEIDKNRINKTIELYGKEETIRANQAKEELNAYKAGVDQQYKQGKLDKIYYDMESNKAAALEKIADDYMYYYKAKADGKLSADRANQGAAISLMIHNYNREKDALAKDGINYNFKHVQWTVLETGAIMNKFRNMRKLPTNVRVAASRNVDPAVMTFDKMMAVPEYNATDYTKPSVLAKLQRNVLTMQAMKDYAIKNRRGVIIRTELASADDFTANITSGEYTTKDGTVDWARYFDAMVKGGVIDTYEFKNDAEQTLYLTKNIVSMERTMDRLAKGGAPVANMFSNLMKIKAIDSIYPDLISKVAQQTKETKGFFGSQEAEARRAKEKIEAAKQAIEEGR